MKLPAASLLLAALLAGAATASAQTTFRLGLRGGANRALTTLDPASNAGGGYFSTSASKSALYAWQAGVVLEARCGHFAWQPALVFSQKGEKFTTRNQWGEVALQDIERSSANRYNWLEVPLNAVYTLHGDHGLQVFGGPYVALAVGGHQSGTVTTYNSFSSPGLVPPPVGFENPISYDRDAGNRRLDAGVNFGIGYRQGPLQVQLGYGLGLRNLHQDTPLLLGGFSHDFNGDAAHNRVAQLTATYFVAR